MQSASRSWISVFVRELRRMVKEPIYFLMVLLLPLLGIAFFATLFVDGKPQELPIGVVDKDNSKMSRQLIRMVDAAPTPMVKQNVGDLTEARKGIIRGKYYGVLVIPEGFQKDVYKSKQPDLAFYYNNAFMVPASLINKDVSTVVSTFSAGINVNKRTKLGEPRYRAMVSVNPIAVDAHNLFNPEMNYYYYLATAFLPIMLLIFITMGTVYVIGVEYKEGTAREWLQTANGSIVRALTGKLLPYALIYFLLMIFTNTIMFNYYQVPVSGNHLLLVINAFLFVVAYMAVGIFIIAIFPALRMGLSVASIYSAMAFSFSGLTFPFIAMHPFIAFFGNIFPFTHYLTIFMDQTLRGTPVLESFGPMVILNVFLLLPFTVLPKLKKMCVNENYWRKM